MQMTHCGRRRKYSHYVSLFQYICTDLHKCSVNNDLFNEHFVTLQLTFSHHQSKGAQLKEQNNPRRQNLPAHEKKKEGFACSVWPLA